MNDPYTALLNAENGSPEHLEALAEIQSQERAEAKARENVIQGTGRSGHAYASYTIVPNDLVPSYESRTIGAMQEGVASPDLREDIVRIGDFETSTSTAEAMRRSMSPQEWTALTGLPYTSLTQVQHVFPDEKTKAAQKLAPIQEQLDAVIAADDLAEAKADEERITKENELQSYDKSVLEHVLADHYGVDLADKVSREVVESGVIDDENLHKLGVTPDMMEETVAHYRSAAEAMLQPIGSCTAYMESFLSDAEAKAARQAIVSRDLAKVQKLGERARDRAAAMSFAEVSDFLSREERLQLRLRQQGALIMVDLPKIGTTSWASAVTNGLISFK